jgi:hypothetical protein
VSSDPSRSSLHTAVAEAYIVFARHAKPPRPLDVCLACCVSAEVEQQLREWPLRRLPATHFYEYNGSAKSEVQTSEEVGYFLPRMLELLAEGADVHHSIELSLDRLGRCARGSWTQKEQTLLDRFALAYFDAVLRGGSLADGHRQWLDDPLSVLLMFDIGGFAIEPLLELWLESEHPYGTVQFVRTTYWDFWEHCEYSNAFASDRPEFRGKIRAWLLAPEHRQGFAAKMVSAEFLALAEVQGPVGHTSFSTMVEGVFEQLAQ